MHPDFVSVKLLNGQALTSPAQQETLLDELFEDGHEVHGWGYHYCDSPVSARKEAERAAAVCRQFDLEVYHWNAEAQWSRGHLPWLNACIFAEVFRSHVPAGTKLWANCFSEPTKTAQAELFDVWEPMLYGTSWRSQSWAFRRRLDKFKKKVPSQERCAMIGTGRLDDENKPTAIWSHNLKLIQKHRPKYVNYFRAPLNWFGNQSQPSVLAQIRELRGD